MDKRFKRIIGFIEKSDNTYGYETELMEDIESINNDLTRYKSALALATESARSWQYACQCHQSDYKAVTVESFLAQADKEKTP